MHDAPPAGVVRWIAVAVLITALAGSVGRHYATDFTLPGAQSQQASELLTQEFKARSGDVDTIVLHVSRGKIDSPRVRTAVKTLLAGLRTLPHIVAVRGPYSGRGSVQISSNRMTAFATMDYDKRANLLPADVGKSVLDRVNAVHVPGLTVAAGGQVIEAAEGFSIGPATTVGVIAALVILLMTFGSLTAAGMPLLTAGLGLITSTGLIGLATRVTSMSNIAPQLALMIGLGVGVDYALFTGQHVDAWRTELGALKTRLGVARPRRSDGDTGPVRLEHEPYTIRVAIRQEDVDRRA